MLWLLFFTLDISLLVSWSSVRKRTESLRYEITTLLVSVRPSNSAPSGIPIPSPFVNLTIGPPSTVNPINSPLMVSSIELLELGPMVLLTELALGC